MSRLAPLAALLCLSPVFGQSDDKKEFEKKVAETLANFQKAAKGATQAGLAQAIPMLDGLNHDKVIAELGNCMKGSDEMVKLEAIKVLSKLDNPAAARVLAQNIKPNTKSLTVIKAIAGCLKTVAYDELYASFGFDLAKQAFDGDFAEPYWDYLGLVDDQAAIMAVDGLVKMLWEMEEGKRFGFKAPDDQYENKVRGLLKKLTGEQKASSNDYKSAWGGIKSANASKYLYIMWCPVTQKRWERKGNDAKAVCPHHEDKRGGAKCGSVVALTCFR